MTGWNSTIPGTISALVALWQNAPALAGVSVADGQSSESGASQAVTVGYNGDGDDAVTGTTTAEGFGGEPNREDYTILCSAAAVTGDDDQSAARSAAFDLYAACCDALLADHTLGDTVLRAMPGDFTVRQQSGDRGRGCLILFGVNVTAYTV